MSRILVAGDGWIAESERAGFCGMVLRFKAEDRRDFRAGTGSRVKFRKAGEERGITPVSKQRFYSSVQAR